MLLLFLCDSDYFPRASLTLQTGQPVVQPHGYVILRLDHSSGLQGWNCFVTRSHSSQWIALNQKGDNMSLEFQTNGMTRPENIFWCSNADKSKRSNQVTIRTSSRCSNLQIRLCSSNTGGGTKILFAFLTLCKFQLGLWFCTSTIYSFCGLLFNYL